MSYKFKSVKLWIGVTLFVMGTVFAFIMGASFKDWADFAWKIFVFYVTGNVLSKSKKPVNMNIKMDPSVPPENNNAFVFEEVPPNERCH